MIHIKAHLPFAASFVVLLSVIVLSSAGCLQQSGPPEKITIAYAATTSAVLVQIAFVKGYFEEEGWTQRSSPMPLGNWRSDGPRTLRRHPGVAFRQPLV